MSELYAEAVGNKYLAKEYQLNAQQIAVIRALGWVIRAVGVVEAATVGKHLVYTCACTPSLFDQIIPQ